MFDTTYNPVQHEVVNSKCLYCKQSLPGHGAIYTKQDAVLQFIPPKSILCKEIAR